MDSQWKSLADIRPKVIALLKHYGPTEVVADVVGIGDETVQLIYSRKREYVIGPVAEKIEDAFDALPKQRHRQRIVAGRGQRKSITARCSEDIRPLIAGEGTGMYWDGPKPAGIGGTLRELAIGTWYSVAYDKMTGIRHKNVVTGKVIGEYAHYYLFEDERGLKSSVLKNDLCLETTRVNEKISLDRCPSEINR